MNPDDWKVCPLCFYTHPPEHVHWIEAAESDIRDQPGIPAPVSGDGKASAGIPEALERVPRKEGRDREKYNAYMRRYMSERRKNKKAQGAMA